MRIVGQVAMVTRASSGIGSVVAQEPAVRGAWSLVHGRRPGAVHVLPAGLRSSSVKEQA